MLRLGQSLPQRLRPTARERPPDVDLSGRRSQLCLLEHTGPGTETMPEDEGPSRLDEAVRRIARLLGRQLAREEHERLQRRAGNEDLVKLEKEEPE
jgi:hypothetical protein